MSENNEVTPKPSGTAIQIPLIQAIPHSQTTRFRNPCTFNRAVQQQYTPMFCPVPPIPVNYTIPMFQQAPDPYYNPGYAQNSFFNCPPPPIPCTTIPMIVPNIHVPPPPLPQPMQHAIPMTQTLPLASTSAIPVNIPRSFARFPTTRQPFSGRFNTPRPFRPRTPANPRFRGSRHNNFTNCNPRFNNIRSPANRFPNNPRYPNQVANEDAEIQSDEEHSEVDLLYQSTAEKNRIIDERQHPSNGFSGSKMHQHPLKGGRLFLDSSSSSNGEDDDEVVAVSFPDRWRNKIIEFDTSPVSSEYGERSVVEESDQSSSEDSQASYFSSTRSDITNSSDYYTSSYGDGSLPDITSSSGDDTPLVIVPDPYYR